MKKPTITLQKLERMSGMWDRRTIELMVFIGGGANMFGGHSEYVHVVLHGDNSIQETGTIEYLGFVQAGWNIARGANGENSSTANYRKFVSPNTDELGQIIYSVEIKGTSGGADNAMCSILNAHKDYLNK